MLIKITVIWKNIIHWQYKLFKEINKSIKFKEMIGIKRKYNWTSYILSNIHSFEIDISFLNITIKYNKIEWKKKSYRVSICSINPLT